MFLVNANHNDVSGKCQSMMFLVNANHDDVPGKCQS